MRWQSKLGRSAGKKKEDMAEQSLLGVQGIHPWNGHGYFCGQGKYDGKANLVGVQGKIKKTWQNTLCWGFRGFTPGTGLFIFVDKGNEMVKQTW